MVCFIVYLVYGYHAIVFFFFFYRNMLLLFITPFITPPSTYPLLFIPHKLHPIAPGLAWPASRFCCCFAKVFCTACYCLPATACSCLLAPACRWYTQQLGRAMLGRMPAHMTKDELIKVVGATASLMPGTCYCLPDAWNLLLPA